MKLLNYIILHIVFGLPQLAVGQQCPDSTTPSADRARAREMFEQGVQYFSANRYNEALETFNCSYRFYPHRDTLFNIGRSNEELGNYKTASESYRLYIERYPEAPDIADIEARVLSIEERIDEKILQMQQRLQSASETVTGEQQSLEVEQAIDVERPFVLTQGMEGVQGVQMSVARKSAWTTLALGLALTGSGAGFLGASLSLLEDIDGREQTQYCSIELEQISDRGRVYMPAGIALMGTGVATLITSIVLFTVFDAEQAIGQARGRSFGLGAVATGQGGGFVLSGRF